MGRSFVVCIAISPKTLTFDSFNARACQVFVLADHAEPGSRGPSSDSPSADAYAPAYNVSLHTLSMVSVYRRSFITDFARVEGVPGYYLANQIDHRLSTRMFSYLNTKLSKNGGAKWDLIPPPEEFRYTQCNSCEPGSTKESCALHLHGPTSYFAPEGQVRITSLPLPLPLPHARSPSYSNMSCSTSQHPNFYSIESAPGIIVATGNVGAHLNFHQDADCTYLSRDGGSTWTDVAPYTAIYEIGSSGGTIVMAKHLSEGPTSEVQFSLDQGACFHTIKLPKALLVENIRAGTGDEANTFYVYGSVCSTIMDPLCTFDGGSPAQGILFVIRLSDLLAEDWKVCDTSASSHSYENFDFGGDCLLGRQCIMRRRAATGDDFCANPTDFKQHVTLKDRCKCTDNDIECEFGYIRAGDSCVPIDNFSPLSACPRLSESRYVASDSHQRLVHNNFCTGVNAIIPDTNGKGGRKGSDDSGRDSSGCHHASALKALFMFIISSGAILGIVGIVWSQCMTPEQQHGVLALLAPLGSKIRAGFEVALGVVVEAYAWARQKLKSLLGDRSEEREYYEALGDTDDDPRRGLDDVDTLT